MHEKDKERRLEAVRNALFVPIDQKDRRTTIFLEEFYTILLRHSERHGFTFQPDLLSQITDALKYCQKNDLTVCFTEIGSALYALSIFAPLEIDYWMNGIADMLHLDSGKRERCDYSIPHIQLLAGYTLGLFYTIRVSKVCSSPKKETSENFAEVFINVISRIIIFGGQYPITGYLDIKKFQNCLSAQTKFYLLKYTSYLEDVQALYRSVLKDLPVKKYPHEELGKILYYEMLHALVGSLEPDELQAWLFPKKE